MMNLREDLREEATKVSEKLVCENAAQIRDALLSFSEFVAKRAFLDGRIMEAHRIFTENGGNIANRLETLRKELAEMIAARRPIHHYDCEDS